MTILAAILGIFGSSGFGALLGGATGLFKQWMDTRNRQMELDHEKNLWAHNLKVKEADLALVHAENQGKKDIAIAEGSATVEAAAYTAMSASFASDKISDKAWEVMAESRWGRAALVVVECMQRSVRPVLTYALTLMALYMNWQVISYLGNHWLLVDQVSKVTLASQVIGWTLFQASAVLSYWFVNRPTAQALK